MTSEKEVLMRLVTRAMNAAYNAGAADESLCAEAARQAREAMVSWESELRAALAGSAESSWVSVADNLPPDETPVFVVRKGVATIGERRWEHPGYEDTFTSHWYWAAPDDSWISESPDEVSAWTLLPELPTKLVHVDPVGAVLPAPTWEALHAAWKAVGADLKGLRWDDFVGSVLPAPDAPVSGLESVPRDEAVGHLMALVQEYGDVMLRRGIVAQSDSAPLSKYQAEFMESAYRKDAVDAALREALAAAPKAQPSQAAVPMEWKKAVQEAYGWLWHVNNEPMAPVPLWSPEKAAYEARKNLRDLLTKDERGEAINAVRGLLSNKAALAAAPKAQPSQVDPLGTSLNDAAWAFVEAMPHQLPGAIFNCLKGALRAAIETYLATSQAQAQPQQAVVANVTDHWTDAKLRGIASDYFPEAKDWPAAMLCMRHLLMEQRAALASQAQAPQAQTLPPAVLAWLGAACSTDDLAAVLHEVLRHD